MMDTDVNININDNIAALRSRISSAAYKAGRNPRDITLVAVTKTVEPERIIEAINGGITHLGENRVQELIEKYDAIPQEVKWHMIGHLQTNKVKYIVGKVSLVHSVDRIELVKEIDRRAGRQGTVMDVLIQVNVAGEQTKFGIAPVEVEDMIEEIRSYRSIRVRGLMTIAPYADNTEEIRYVFKELNKKFIDIKRKNIDNIDMDYLSMGMSNDFETAIEEGSNMVRIGSAIFGKRKY